MVVFPPVEKTGSRHSRYQASRRWKGGPPPQDFGIVATRAVVLLMAARRHLGQQRRFVGAEEPGTRNVARGGDEVDHLGVFSLGHMGRPGGPCRRRTAKWTRACFSRRGYQAFGHESI